jgi:hypothetical protein
MVRTAGILTLLILCTIAGCSKTDPPVDTTKVDALTKEVLVAISEGKASEVYLTHFTEEFRNDQPEDIWKVTTDPIQTTLGKCISVKLQKKEMQHAEGIVVGLLIYDVEWIKESGVVTVNATFVDNKWSLGNITVFCDALEPVSIKRPVPTSRPVFTPPTPTPPVTP